MFGEMWAYEICSVCFWEDDLPQMRWPLMAAGANAFSLVEAQRNYQRFGATEERFRNNVRPPRADEPLDPGWRPIDLTRDSFEGPGSSASWLGDLTTLYWCVPPSGVATRTSLGTSSEATPGFLGRRSIWLSEWRSSLLARATTWLFGTGCGRRTTRAPTGWTRSPKAPPPPSTPSPAAEPPWGGAGTPRPVPLSSLLPRACHISDNAAC
jgi:hypothetical protein